MTLLSNPNAYLININKPNSSSHNSTNCEKFNYFLNNSYFLWFKSSLNFSFKLGFYLKRVSFKNTIFVYNLGSNTCNFFLPINASFYTKSSYNYFFKNLNYFSFFFNYINFFKKFFIFAQLSINFFFLNFTNLFNQFRKICSNHPFSFSRYYLHQHQISFRSYKNISLLTHNALLI